ncbi:hypothetical protein AB0H83_17980 [Dactylosporangium sp. NPDC050688]|uniref:hypothetical protein n=1 Tax=Dactylosporangium sp. NPDC050688 TaxID=3157217 RepID=UPI0033E821CE
MADDDEARADAARRADLAAFAESWQLLGVLAIVHLWPPMPWVRRGAPATPSQAGAGRKARAGRRGRRRAKRRGGWWRCACGTRRWQLRRSVRAVRAAVVSGLVWFGLSTGAGLSADALAGVGRWCDGMREIPVPCCPRALDELGPAGSPG